MYNASWCCINSSMWRMEGKIGSCSGTLQRNMYRLYWLQGITSTQRSWCCHHCYSCALACDSGRWSSGSGSGYLSAKAHDHASGWKPGSSKCSQKAACDLSDRNPDSCRWTLSSYGRTDSFRKFRRYQHCANIFCDEWSSKWNWTWK